MCTDSSAIEDSNDGSKHVDSVVLRIKKQDNCTCHVSLQKTVTDYTIYMSKYEGRTNAAPIQPNCGLAVDVEYVYTSETSQPLPPIKCTTGTGMRPIVLGGNKLKLKSRVIDGNFTRGYCMQIYRYPIYTCNMTDHVNKAGSDNWIPTTGIHHLSFDACKSYCLQTTACLSVDYDYESVYCFVYNRTTTKIEKSGSTYSQKQCFDTQKIKIMCYRPESTTETSERYPPESTTETSEGYPPESTTKTSKETSTGISRTTKPEKFTTSISNNNNNPMTNSNTQSTITVEKDTIIDKNSDLYVYLGAAAGGVLMVLLIICIIVCIRKSSNQTSEKQSKTYAKKQFCREDRDSDNDYGGLKDNVLYVSSEPNEILEDGNYHTVDLEQTRKGNQDNNFDGNYSTVDGIIGSYIDSSLSKSKPVIKPKPKTNGNSSLKRGSDEETIHLSTMNNSNNEYAIVDKGRNSDAVKHINPEHGNDTEYAVVNKVKKSSNNN